MSAVNPMTLADVPAVLAPHGQLQTDIDAKQSTIYVVAVVGAVAASVFCYAGMLYGHHRLISYLETIGKISIEYAVPSRLVPFLLVHTVAAAGIGYGSHEAIVAIGKRRLVQPLQELRTLAISWAHQPAVLGPEHFRQLAASARPHHLCALLPNMAVHQQIQLRHTMGATLFDRMVTAVAATNILPYWKSILALPSNRAELVAYLENENIRLRFKYRPDYLEALARIISERIALDEEITALLEGFYQRVTGSTIGQDEFLRAAAYVDYNPRIQREDSVEIESATGSLYADPAMLVTSHVSRQVVDGQFRETREQEMSLLLTQGQLLVFETYLKYVGAASVDSAAGDELTPLEKLYMIDLIDYMQPNAETIKHLRERLDAWREHERTTTTVEIALRKWREACRNRHDCLRDLYLETLRKRLAVPANVQTLFRLAGTEELPEEILNLIPE